MAVTSKIIKNLTLDNQIIVDNVVVKCQTAKINSETGQLDLSNWVTSENVELYKSNRIEARRLEAEFEDLAFAEQDAMIVGGAE